MYKTYRKEMDFTGMEWSYTYLPPQNKSVYYKMIPDGFGLDIYGVDKRGDAGDYLVKSPDGYDIIKAKEFEESTGVTSGNS
jgi:hypothetical protein